MGLLSVRSAWGFLLLFALLGSANAIFTSCSVWLTPNETLTLESLMTTLEVGQSPGNWWDATLQGCQSSNNSRGGVTSLYWSSGTADFDFIRHTLDGPGQFWTGGLVVHTPWMWADGRPVYRYEGTGSVRGNITDFKTITDNDAFLCHHQCRDSPGLDTLGLQGDVCFCGNNASLGNTTEPEFHCTGTYMEHCGTRVTVSLYGIDLPAGMSWSVSREGVLYQGFCGYVRLNMDNSTVDLIPATDCNRTQHFVCQFDSPSTNDNCSSQFCAFNTSATWRDSMSECQSKGGNLAAPNDTNMAEFLAALSPMTSYWIGVSRGAELRTIDGTVVEAVSQTMLIQGRLCQALEYNNVMLMSQLLLCSVNLRSLSFIDTPGVTRMTLPPTSATTTPETTTMTMTTMTTTIARTTATPMPSTDAATQAGTSPPVTAQPFPGGSSSANQPSNHTSIVAGAVIAGILVLIIILFVLFYMKREGKLCFTPMMSGEERLSRDFDAEVNHYTVTNGAAMAETGFILEREEGIDLDSPGGSGPPCADPQGATSGAGEASQGNTTTTIIVTQASTVETDPDIVDGDDRTASTEKLINDTSESPAQPPDQGKQSSPSEGSGEPMTSGDQAEKQATSASEPEGQTSTSGEPKEQPTSGGPGDEGSAEAKGESIERDLNEEKGQEGSGHPEASSAEPTSKEEDEGDKDIVKTAL